MFYSSKVAGVDNVQRLTMDTIVKRLGKKNNVSIISCYYGTQQLSDLFKQFYELGRQGRTTTIIVSSHSNNRETLISQLEELVKIELNQTQNLLLCRKFPLLHTKLFFSTGEYVSQNTICLMGSFNISKNALTLNEEVLADITDQETKKSAYEYFQKIIKEKSNINIRDLRNEFKSSGNLDLREFLSERLDKNDEQVASTVVLDFINAGYLFVKATRNFSLSYMDDIWKNWVAHANFDVSHTSISLSIEVENILGIQTEKNTNDSNNVKNNAIETCFGYWIPQGKKYSNIRNNIESQKDARKGRCEMLLSYLQRGMDDKAYSRLRNTFDDLNAKMPENEKLKESDFEKLKNSFENHLSVKKRWLERNKDVYIQNGYYLSPMPYIWDDTNAVDNFIRSFEDDLALRNAENGKKMPSAICKYLEIDPQKDSIDLNKKLQTDWNKFENDFWKE